MRVLNFSLSSVCLLQARKSLDPDAKFRYPLCTSFRHGWNLRQFVDIRDLKGPLNARRKVIEQTFYSLNGVPGIQRDGDGDKPLL